MANLTLVRTDSFLEHLKPGVKLDTFSSLRNCLLNCYALLPVAVIRNAEDEIAQFETNKHTSHPGPHHWGWLVNIRNNKTDINSTCLKKKTGSSGPVRKEMPAWKAVGGRGRSCGRGRGGQVGHGTQPAKDTTQYK